MSHEEDEIVFEAMLPPNNKLRKLNDRKYIITRLTETEYYTEQF